MIGYVKCGADDLDAARRFYDAVLPALGYTFTDEDGGLGYVAADDAGPTLYVDRPFDGGAASGGNGAMIAFAAAGPAQVRDLHAAAMAAGGRDAGAPGHRAAYSPDFYVAYLRDPAGNKIALYARSPDGQDG